MLGAICAGGARLVHLSTDFVFDGRSPRPYLPDGSGTLGVYGASKWQGEQAVLAGDARHVVVRTSWVYGPGGRNCVDHAAIDAGAGDGARGERSNWFPHLDTGSGKNLLDVG